MFRTVGERTGVNSNRRLSRKGSKKPLESILAQLSSSPVSQGQPVAARAKVRLKTDVALILVIFCLLIFGLVILYSASYDYSFRLNEGDGTFMFFRQVQWLILGLVVAIFLTFIDYHLLQRLAVPMIVVTLIMLIAVVIQNNILNGSARTLFGTSVQPSELAKLVTVIYLSIWLYAKQDRLSDISFGLIPLGAIVGGLGGLILIQTDISAAATVFFLGGLMFFLAGGDLRQIGLLLIGALVMGVIVILITPTGMTRVLEYWDGLNNPLNSSYHVRGSFGAFINGSWIGVGIGNGIAKLIYLPVPPTDSIFAVVGEELGMAGSVVLISFYVVFLWRGMTIAKKAPDFLGSLLAGGLTLWIVIEAFFNMAGMVSLLPFPGSALPFISAGGSNLTMCLVAVGILLNISRRSVENSEQTGRLSNAVVDLRGRDRRRRVSSPQRATRPGG